MIVVHSAVFAILLNAGTALQTQGTDITLNYVSECCAPSIKSNHLKLLKCVNASTEQNVKDGWNENAKIKFAFVTYGTMDIAKYSAYAFAVNQAYCEQNNYILRLADPLVSNFEPNDVRWNKVKILELALKGWAKQADYIVWLDADLIIIDIALKLEDLVRKHPLGHLFASASPESTTNTDVMNSGLLILKNSEFITTWLLKKWWNYGKRYANSDQEVFNMLYSEYSDKLLPKVVIVEPAALNSDPPATLKQRPQDPVLHLMGEFDKYRRNAFQTAFEEICRVSYQVTTVKDDASTDNIKFNLRMQLGVTQPRLLALAIVEYSNHSYHLLNQFEARLANGEYNNYDKSSGLSYYMKRYLDMLEHIETSWSSKDKKALKKGLWTTLDKKMYQDYLTVGYDPVFPDFEDYEKKNKSVLGTHSATSDELRKKLYYLFMKNLALSEKIITSNERTEVETLSKEDYHRSRSERASLLYVTIDYGSTYVKLHLVKRMDVKDASKVVKAKDAEIHEILNGLIELSDELISVVDAERKPHCHHLRSDLFVDLAMMKRYQHKKKEVFPPLFRALEEKEEEAKQLGELCLCKVLIIIADQYSQFGQYQDSFQYFDRAIKIQREYMGETQLQLATYFSMSGQSRASAKLYNEAIKLFEKAIKIFQMYPGSVEYQRDMPRAQQLIQLCKDRM